MDIDRVKDLELSELNKPSSKVRQLMGIADNASVDPTGLQELKEHPKGVMASISPEDRTDIAIHQIKNKIVKEDKEMKQFIHDELEREASEELRISKKIIQESINKNETETEVAAETETIAVTDGDGDTVDVTVAAISNKTIIEGDIKPELIALNTTVVVNTEAELPMMIDTTVL